MRRPSRADRYMAISSSSDFRPSRPSISGGSASRTLVEALFAAELDNPLLAPLGDSAVLAAPAGARIATTIDASVVTPLEFPGGDIGSLAVSGTVNDLAMVGARALALTAAFVIEEGFAVERLRRIVASMAAAARVAGVPVAAGDTKVVERGKADGLFIATAGVGAVRDGIELDPAGIRPGDRVLVSGTLGEHGMAIMLARGDLALEAEIVSDAASLGGVVDRVLDACGPAVRCLRDPTRGGLATVLNELARAAGASIALDEAAIPVRPEVAGACELLGIDPLYVANEGKLVAFVPPERAEAVLAAMQTHAYGRRSRVIGSVVAEHPGLVVARTALGGTRVVDLPWGELLPRIC